MKHCWRHATGVDGVCTCSCRKACRRSHGIRRIHPLEEARGATLRHGTWRQRGQEDLDPKAGVIAAKRQRNRRYVANVRQLFRPELLSILSDAPRPGSNIQQILQLAKPARSRPGASLPGKCARVLRCRQQHRPHKRDRTTIGACCFAA